MEGINRNRCLLAVLLASIIVMSAILRLILTASSRTITVPDDYATIQEAINAARESDTVFVRAGQYNETIIIDKTLNLIGEDKEKTIIDGDGAVNIVLVKANYVNITGFTIQNSAKGDITSIFQLVKGRPVGAVALVDSSGCLIKNNIMQNVNVGVHVGKGSNDTTIHNNTIFSQLSGVLIYDASYLFDAAYVPPSGITVSNNCIAFGGRGLNLHGVYVGGASNNKIIANEIWCGRDGIYIGGKDAPALVPEEGVLMPYPSDYNVVSNNSIGGRFYACKSNNNVVYNNSISSIAGGLYLRECSNTTLRNNILSNFGIEGSELSHFMNDIDASNTINGKPIYILINQFNIKINPYTYPNIGYLGIVNSTKITVRRLSMDSKTQGLMLAQTTNCEISEVFLSNNQVGIYLWNCSGNTVMGNVFTNCPTSINMRLCDNNIFRGNTLLRSSINMVNSSNNTFHRNNFIQTHLNMENSVNAWDDRFDTSPPDKPFYCPICHEKRPVGNYWSDYQGKDDGTHTQSHNCDGDRIGDTDVPVHEVDYYPLMNPWLPLLGDVDYDGTVSVVDIFKIGPYFGKTSP